MHMDYVILMKSVDYTSTEMALLFKQSWMSLTRVKCIGS